MLTTTHVLFGTRRRRLLLLAALGGLLLTAAVAADRVLARTAGARVARQLQCVAGLARPPAVTVRGLPFLPQALTGRYRRIDVNAEGVRRGELRLTSVRATLRDTTTSGATASIGAARIEAVAGFGALPDRLGGRDVTYGAAGGLLTISTTASLAGRQLPVTLLARPRISGGSLRVEPQEVEILGIRRPAASLPGRLGTGEIDRKLPSLPAGLRYGGIDVRPEGVAVTAVGTNLTLRVRGAGTRSGPASPSATPATSSPAGSAAPVSCGAHR